jgi:hypothetical protein
MELCQNCKENIDPVLVTSIVAEWDADDEQVEALGPDYRELVEDWVRTPNGVCVGWHICPKCHSGIGKPWIEHSTS